MVVLNIILSAAISVMCVVYAHVGGLMLKALTSSIFALLAGINFGYVVSKKLPDKKYATMIFIGHLISLCADVVINIEFIPGAAIFGVAHVFYFIALCTLRKFRPGDLFCIGGILIFSCVIVLLPVFDYGSSFMKIVCLAYALIISCMLGKSIANAVAVRSFLMIFIAAGSFLFYFSDFMLLIEIFGGGGPLIDDICLYTYFPAQAILAISVFLNVRLRKSQNSES